MNVRAPLLVPPDFLVSTAFEKMRWKDEFGKWFPKLPISGPYHYTEFVVNSAGTGTFQGLRHPL